MYRIIISYNLVVLTHYAYTLNFGLRVPFGLWCIFYVSVARKLYLCTILPMEGCPVYEWASMFFTCGCRSAIIQTCLSDVMWCHLSHWLYPVPLSLVSSITTCITETHTDTGLCASVLSWPYAAHPHSSYFLSINGLDGVQEYTSFSQTLYYMYNVHTLEKRAYY